MITNIPDSTHLTLATAVATAAGQKVADGAVVSLVCGSANPTPYAEWPDAAARDAYLSPTPGAPARGGPTLNAVASTTPAETLTDDPAIAGSASANAASSPARLIYQTPPLIAPLRISGTPRVSLNFAFSRPKANLTAALVSYPATGNGTILTRGWKDPENRSSDFTSEPVTPGAFYRIDIDMQPKDIVVDPGRRLALMVLSRDRDFTIRAPAGTQVTLDLAGSRIALPVVGGPPALASALGWSLTETPAGVGGTVPATLSLSVGGPASFGAFTPGVTRSYDASTTANVVSTAGDAVLSVADPSATATGHLVNGAFSLPSPLPLRTGTYSKTLTFTLSTTTP